MQKYVSCIYVDALILVSRLQAGGENRLNLPSVCGVSARSMTLGKCGEGVIVNRLACINSADEFRQPRVFGFQTVIDNRTASHD
jgi:hypothetical protein